ncbi:endonuclease/exonuclease/phosphatase family protein [Sphingobacterium hotanense]|uniref:endonuclease/exonuclease/phosphatase family protein n=1 Tax=Sphingobacterium hotanense TaxID=649196 RepID=UPI0021A65D25|nr:endonuclease/exonuclease/phosphatase family protein [Sphingobacterium hotanense]MCT1525619.1 endonuclease/exonuclease/phosphatase family protein [Sphingobacterium hotanense]
MKNLRKKRNILFSFSFLLVLVFSSFSVSSVSRESKAKKTRIKVSAYNIRYNANADVKGGNGWDIRKKPLAELIEKHGFEIVGTQEGDKQQMSDLRTLLPAFEQVSYPYGGKGDLHTAAILYKKDRFEVLDQGVFWLSETPDEPSMGWDATDRRICSWAKFKEKKSGKTFYFFNVHFYWRLEVAKRESGPLMVRKIKEIAGDAPAVCVGDFNSTSETSQILAMKASMQDAYDATETTRKGIEDTNLGGGNFLGPAKGRIDYIFVSKNIRVKDYEVYSDRYNGDRYPSDHLPLASTIEF